MLNLTAEQLKCQFQLTLPCGYHPESVLRVAHLSSRQLRKASVLIGFVDRPSGLQVIMMKRAAHLTHHPNQIGFPGGKHETSDLSVYHTALRETEEELGIATRHIQLLGQLPTLNTPSLFSVTPVLAFIQANYQAQIEPNEVAEMFEVPASVLLNPNALFSQCFQLTQHQHRVFALNYRSHFIWGMTAQIIQALQQQLNPLA